MARTRSNESSETGAPTRPGVERLEYRVERLRTTLRFTYAFHTREIRFERDPGDGFQRVFPETFAFRSERHDPAEFYLQLEDLWTKPQLISPKATRRDAESVMVRLAEAMPAYLERVMTRLEAQAALDPVILTHVYEDVGLTARIMARFLADKGLDQQDRVRLAERHLRKVIMRAFRALVERRVDPAYLEQFVEGTVDPVDPSDDLSETGLFYTLQTGSADVVNRSVLRVAERALYGWLEDVCLDESDHAFETENTPFADRESEVMEAVCALEVRSIDHGRDLNPFLRRPGNRDCLRLLGKLETWFLRQYDVHHGAAIIQHAANLRRGECDADGILSVHGLRSYLTMLALLAGPFVGAAFGYQRWPLLFDAAAASMVVGGLIATFWFFLYRFCWKRDLIFFHAAVPRVTAGIIVGYAPVFLIDEVWDLARSPWLQLLLVASLLGFSTLLYLYVEVKGRIADPTVAFQRARGIFLLGVVQAVSVGLVITALLGPFMAGRNWGAQGVDMPMSWLQTSALPVVGQLPPVIGLEPFYAFPSAVFLFTFLSFFIGTFLQLLWEDLPITEPM